MFLLQVCIPCWKSMQCALKQDHQNIIALHCFSCCSFISINTTAVGMLASFLWKNHEVKFSCCISTTEVDRRLDALSSIFLTNTKTSLKKTKKKLTQKQSSNKATSVICTHIRASRHWALGLCCLQSWTLRWRYRHYFLEILKISAMSSKGRPFVSGTLK